MINRFIGMPPNASEHGFLIDHMLEFCHWFMLILFIGWSSFFLYTIIRFHRSRNPKADYHGVKTHASTHLEFMVVLVEAVLLLGFALPLWANRVLDFPKTDAVRIRAVAQQFAWNFHYPGPDGQFGKQSTNLISGSNELGLDRNDLAGQDDIVAKNEFHIPFNRNIVIEVTSKDVIHSFAVQAMRAGQDAIPGQSIPIWFRPIKPGTYEVVCAQLCGLGHFSMKGIMEVQSQAEYEGWLKEMAQNAAPSAPAGTPPPAAPVVPGAGTRSPSAPIPSEQTGDSNVKPRSTGEETPASGHSGPMSSEPHK